MRIAYILCSILFFYTLVTISIVMTTGASMANAEGLVSEQELYNEIVRAVSPTLVYVFAMIVLGLAVMLSKDTSVVQLALERMFQFHLAWFALIVVYYLAAPLAPNLLSHYQSPGAIVLRVLGNAWPFLMLSVFVFFLMAREAEGENDSKMDIR